VLVPTSRGMRAVELCSNKILQLLTGGAEVVVYDGHKAVVVVEPGAVDLVADDHSDHEANVAALQHELEQRKQEVKRLKVEQRARQKEQMKAKERAISQQLHVCHSFPRLLSVTSVSR